MASSRSKSSSLKEGVRDEGWAQRMWQRAFEGSLINPVIGGDAEATIDDGIILHVKELEQNDEDATTSAAKDPEENLQYSPHQHFIPKMIALVLKMQHKTSGLAMVTQPFRNVSDTTNNAVCTLGGCVKKGVPEAFTATSLVQWLTDELKIESYQETCHIATMMCKTGFIYPCRTDWSIKTLRLCNQDENVYYRFQSPYYWPKENLTPTDVDFTIDLLGREGNSSSFALDEYETKYLSRLKKILAHQWGFISKAAQSKESIMQQVCITDQHIKRWQELAHWKINRPQCYHRCIGSSNPNSWNLSLRGLYRNLPPDSGDNVAVEKEKKSALAPSPSRVLTSSCNRIRSACLERECFDPFLVQDPDYINPWKVDNIRNAWPKEPTEDTGPYKLQCKGWSVDFDFLLKDDLGRDIFERHLKKEFSEENLAFYDECVYLRSAPKSEVDALVKTIFDQFVATSAPTPINIDTHTANEVKKQMEVDRTRYTFDAALEHIYKLMKKDSYKRFVSSSIYKDALAQANHPTIQTDKGKSGLPRIWRLSQFMPKNKSGEGNAET